MVDRHGFALAIRQFQLEAPLPYSQFFKAMHTFIDRTYAEFFRDEPDMPLPILEFRPIEGEWRGLFWPLHVTMIPAWITIDPFKAESTSEMLEVFVHELVHLWEWHVGYPVNVEDNEHGQQFLDRIHDFGIVAVGKKGRARGYIGEVWENWLKRNADLNGYLEMGDAVEPA
jgi:hypothetical protein